MHTDLESIVAADEEARARVKTAEERRDRTLASARASRDASIEARRNAERDALDKELRSIREEGERRVEELRGQQQTYLKSLAEGGERNFDAAVAAYLRIVGVIS